ncbi:endonuclease/exonuclease/phosphatase family protein [Desertihabitans aurantiacus]|uniref:endonuclease/exonuclease/phosphatase family protein n=1 Tax=Desertihabitans aurantiacus TaxID=2282477 RepID=UPI000DF7BE6F|nr:endonuclease/exonuclease/phosphatase family protein [Desertihabitans aurantiacus]
MSRRPRTTRRFRLGAVAASMLAALLALSPLGPAPASAAEQEELEVMSFNLRYASDTPPNSWQERRPVTRQLLQRERPHLIGTQEGLYEQLRDIEDDLRSRYDSIGLGREGGSRGEFMMIFFDRTRLDPLEYDHFWLSDTPDVVGSQTWGGCCPRMVTWVRFLDRVTGQEFYAVNTHLEAFDATARAKSADLILERMAAFDPELPVVMTGDFNEPAGAGGRVYDTLVTDGPLVDTWEVAEERGELVGTFPNYQAPVPGGPRIDWVLTSPEVDVRRAEINTFRRGGQFPSDHLPVQASLVLPTS